VGLVATNPVTAAKIAGLRYVTDRMPGIRRVGAGKAFRYFDVNGRLIRAPGTLARIRSLAIPPAWADVWICPLEEGHLQAVGRDARHRKQYRYHPRWRQVRDETKFYRMVDFGKLLPKIRARVKRDLAREGLPKEKVLATLVRLLESTLVRVGNEEYTRQNDSYGLTTLRNRHVDIAGAKLSFYFRGKSGRKHAISVTDPHLAKIVRRLRDLPGYELFQYVDELGERRSIGSSDVNEYLREITSDDFTAKDFRTWAGTVLAVEALCDCEAFTTQRQAKKNINAAVEKVAEKLGNTVAVCKKCYIHPAVFETYEAGALTRPPGESRKFARLLKKWSTQKPKLTLEKALANSVKAGRKK
jgi:DNA topoisomerase I